jgi:hypothetical protein
MLNLHFSSWQPHAPSTGQSEEHGERFAEKRYGDHLP